MIDTALSAALEESVADILEKMFFIPAVSSAPAVSSGGLPEIAAQLSFLGEPSGILTLRVSQDLARSIGADFLGVDMDEVSQQQVEQVICELANMICGSVLSRARGATTFHLLAPAIVPLVLPPADPERAASHTVTVDGGSLTVVLEAEPVLCPAKEKFAY